ncbi:MAG TPA: hypothetical protein VE421_05950 [Burkholderiaceae bacterium]|nr:hypothetical protein [Burkholderiaceae bacterium]
MRFDTRRASRGIQPCELGGPAPPIRSFWIGGFEGADHINGAGHALDPATANDHLMQAESDYALLARAGVRTVRESLGWRLTETSDGFDFSRVRKLTAAAHKNGIQILWTLMHYGVPADVDYLDEKFVARFVRFAEAAAREIARVSSASDAAPIYTPINEINFIAWAVAQTDLIFPYRGDARADALGFELKRRLVRATLLAMEAIRAIDPSARFMHVDPVVHVVAPDDAPELVALATTVRAYQWQSWDMLTGRIAPELGGRPDAIDFIGVNHYHSSQWEVGTERRLEWHLRDPRRAPLAELLIEVHQRYQLPIVIAETGHFGAGRSQWFDEMAREVFRAHELGVPVHGFCMYPVIDRCDWNLCDHWHNSGLWDIPAEPDGTRRKRLLDWRYARALKRWQRRFAGSSHASRQIKTLMPESVPGVPAGEDVGELAAFSGALGRERRPVEQLARSFELDRLTS